MKSSDCGVKPADAFSSASCPSFWQASGACKSSKVSFCSFQGEEAIRLYNGEAADAFEALPDPSGHASALTPLHELLGDKVDIGEAVCTPPGCEMDLEAFFEAVYGRASNFMVKYQTTRKARDVAWTAPHLTPANPFGAFARLKCKMSLPVLGEKPFDETLRLAYCLHRDRPSLVVQSLGVIAGGMFAGTIRTETFYTFWREQPEAGPIWVKVISKTPEGRFTSKAIEGSQQAFEDFRATCMSALKTYIRRHTLRRKTSVRLSRTPRISLGTRARLSVAARPNEPPRLDLQSKIHDWLDNCEDVCDETKPLRPKSCATISEMLAARKREQAEPDMPKVPRPRSADPRSGCLYFEAEEGAMNDRHSLRGIEMGDGCHMVCAYNPNGQLCV